MPLYHSGDLIAQGGHRSRRPRLRLWLWFLPQGCHPEPCVLHRGRKRPAKDLCSWLQSPRMRSLMDVIPNRAPSPVRNLLVRRHELVSAFDSDRVERAGVSLGVFLKPQERASALQMGWIQSCLGLAGI